MAGRVLRSSNGRYAGSTRGWGAGRHTHGGGFGGGIKGKTRSVAAQRRIQRGQAVGKAIGRGIAKGAVVNVVGVGALVGARKLGISSNKVAAASFVGGTAYAVAKHVLKTKSIPKK